MTIIQVVFGLACGSTLAARAKASSAIRPRASLWMTWAVTPTVPGGPSGRRCPTPNRWISIGMVSGPLLPGPAPSLLPSAAAASDGRLRIGELLLGEVALAGQPLLVRPLDRREADEADPDERPDADDLGQQHDEEVEDEERLDE